MHASGPPRRSCTRPPLPLCTHACRQLHAVSLLPQLQPNRELHLDLSSDLWANATTERFRSLQHSLRRWAAARAASLRSLSVQLPGEPHEHWDAVQQRSVPLLAALVACLGPALRSLTYRFTCYAAW